MYAEFMPDAAVVAHDVVVGRDGWAVHQNPSKVTVRLLTALSYGLLI
jgi:hypothetical protein